MSFNPGEARTDIVPTKHDGFFPITHVHRDDLENIGYDTSKVDDDTMQELARKMGNAYVENCFWIDLPIIADILDIPKHGDSDDDNEDED